MTQLICFAYTETLSHAHGNTSEQTVWRAGKIVGPLSRALDRIYRTNITETNDSNDSYSKKFNYQHDIEMFLREFKGEKLFQNIPGRCHPTFPNFKFSRGMKNPSKLKQRLVKYGKKLDRSRALFY